MSLGGGGGGGELQALSQELQELQQQIEFLEEEIESVRAEQREIDDAVEALDALETGSTVQVPLGGGAYVRAELLDLDEVVVEIGGDYAVEREEEGAVETLERKRETLDDRIDELNEEIAAFEAESDELESRAQQLQQQQMQQQMQGMQGMGGEAPDE